MFPYRFTFQPNTTVFLAYFVTLRLGTAIPSSSECMKSLICRNTHVTCGSVSSVGIATELRAGRAGIESRWGRDFPPVQTGPGAHPASCEMGSSSFPVVKCGRGVMLTTHHLLVPRLWKSKAIPLPTLWATTGL
jgi:hypothetical protein